MSAKRTDVVARMDLELEGMRGEISRLTEDGAAATKFKISTMTKMKELQARVDTAELEHQARDKSELADLAPAAKEADRVKLIAKQRQDIVTKSAAARYTRICYSSSPLRSPPLALTRTLTLTPPTHSPTHSRLFSLANALPVNHREYSAGWNAAAETDEKFEVEVQKAYERGLDETRKQHSGDMVRALSECLAAAVSLTQFPTRVSFPLRP